MRVLILLCLMVLSVARATAQGADLPAAAKRIDSLVEKTLAAHQVKPNPTCSDDLFVRRCFLDCIGRIPTYAEYRAFSADTAADKRHALIARLLASDGHFSHEFN